MKLATFNAGTGDHVGIVDGDEVVDLTAADPSLATMIDLLERDPREAASAGSSSASRLGLSGVRLRPPVPRPPKFLAIGYRRVSAETPEVAADLPAGEGDRAHVSGPSWCVPSSSWGRTSTRPG